MTTIDQHDLGTKFGGRTLYFTVVINTDEDIHEVSERLRAAASGPQLRMAICAGSILTLEEGERIWEALRNDYKKQVSAQKPTTKPWWKP